MKPHPSDAAPDPASVRAELRRILASPEFAASERMKRFLNLAVIETLAGRAHELKEYRFGVEVFDRPASFDPSTDPIVRVEARRVRAKLAKYYEAAGLHDDTVIELPKGAYVPCFRKRAAHSALSVSGSPVRVAVLPFVDLTGSPDGMYVADGLTWELIHALTRVKEIAVVAWNSSAQLRGERQPDVAMAREKLQAQSVLAGSVRRFGDSVRVVAQLIDAISGVYLWSETYDRRLEHAADIQREISEAIIASLRIRLGGGDAVVRAPAPYNPEAYQLYLKGRGQWNRRSEAGIRDALVSFQNAVALDANFAVAYAGMADAHALLAEYGLEPPGAQVLRGKNSALRALEIDPSLGEAHCSLGLLVAIYEWNWAAAEAHFRKALDLNPGYATTHHWFGCDFLPVVGRLAEAQREVDIALALDPLSSIIAEGKAMVHLFQRRYAEAEAILQAVAQAEPTFYKAYTSLGRVYIQMGRYDDALQMLERGRSLEGDPPSILAAMGQAYGLSGRTDEARRVLAQLKTMRNERFAPATSLALVHLGLGERDEAVEWLGLGLDHREANVIRLGVHPAYDLLHDHPQFRGLLKRLGLALYNPPAQQMAGC